MSPARTNGKKGSFIINRVFANVGLVKKSLNTESLKEWRQRVALLERIHKQEHYELLREFARPHSDVTIEYLIELDLRGDLAIALTSLKLRDNLWDAIEKALPTLAESKATNYRYATSLRALQRKGKRWLSDRARVSDLASVDWKALKREWGASGTDFMHLRRAVGRFLTIHLGDVYHPFRRQVMKKDNFPTARVHKRKPSLSVEQFESIIAKLPEQARPAFWAIVIVGLRLGEYTQALPEHLNASTRTLYVPARKTEDSDGLLVIDELVWDTVANAIPSRHRARWLEKLWADAVKKAKVTRTTIHDLRHVHGQWAINAGVPESMVQSSFRHKSPGMTRDYVMQRDSGVVSAAIAGVLTTPKRKHA